MSENRLEHLRRVEQLTVEYMRPPNRLAVYKHKLLYVDEQVIVSLGVAHPKKPIIVEGRVVIDSGYPVVWFVFPGEWYDVGKVYNRNNRLDGYYSDIIKPVRIEGATVKVTDLFLDLWVSPEWETVVLDEDEYREAVEKKWLDRETATEAKSKLGQLIDLANKRLFPPEFVIDFQYSPQ